MVDDFQKWMEKAQPELEKIVRLVSAQPGKVITGFIFSEDPKGFVRFGNVQNEGEDLVRMHKAFATISYILAHKAQVHPTLQSVPFFDIDFGKYTSNNEEPEPVADELAQMVLITGLEDSRKEQIMGLAKRYLDARFPTPKLLPPAPGEGK